MFRQIGFEALGEFAPREHDAPSAALAFKPNVRAKTCDRPFIRTAWMLFAKSQVVVKAEVREHERISK